MTTDTHVGRLIAIEGIDGSGKGTQTRLLMDTFRSRGMPAELFQFPQYDSSFFGKEVGKYLHGDYGRLEQVPPKFSAILYALDRFEAKTRIESAIADGRIVICDRYTSSNIAHQSARTKGEDRMQMVKWIESVEYDVLGLPPPDLVIFLDSTVRLSQALVELKEARTYTDKLHDIQEESKDHLQTALDQFRDLASSSSWRSIQCVSADGRLRTPNEIHKEVLEHIDNAFR